MEVRVQASTPMFVYPFTSCKVNEMSPSYTDIFFDRGVYPCVMQNNTNKKPIPLAYIITCNTYEAWLHGDERGSVDPKHNKFLAPRIKSDPGFHKTMQNRCKEMTYVMNAKERQTVLQSIIDTCQFTKWHLHAAHVRTKHMHIVVRAPKEPGKVAVSFKAYATRYLKQYYPELNRQRYWSRGESTGYIFRSDYLLRAIQYTVEEQGREMACYCDPSYYNALESL